MEHCQSCAMPMEQPEQHSPDPRYCAHCADDEGRLRAEAEVARGIAEWFKMWQPGLDDARALARAEIYMKSMPAWAD
jgi:hypothetical protein